MPPIELTVLDAVWSGLASHVLRVFILLREGALKHVCLELLSPTPLLRLECKQQADPCGVATCWGARLRHLR